ncbi:hypothetical protein JTE90_011452 [Oedothorax gibbosus]|uniref:MATH domain-containing protein n=1 Tax=Oedothorax gibbosus TaxID=931172 RepID=A0AAV6VE17_9ARAC|nr:hypothetical protein JTE90_011452 [Oedothorax gibbosus]
MSCFTIIWKIENFNICLKNSNKAKCDYGGPVFKTDSTTGRNWWKLNVDFSSNLFYFSVRNLKGDPKETRYEINLLSSSGEVKLNYNSIFSSPKNTLYYSFIDKNEIFSEKEQSLLLHNTLTVCCKIRHPTLKSGECLLRTVLYKRDFIWKIEGLNAFVNNSALCHQGTLNMILTISKIGPGNYNAVVESLPSKDGWPAFVDGELAFVGKEKDRYVLPQSDSSSPHCMVWNIQISAKNNVSKFHLQLKAMVAVHMTHSEELSIPSDEKSVVPETVPALSTKLPDAIIYDTFLDRGTA